MPEKLEFEQYPSEPSERYVKGQTLEEYRGVLLSKYHDTIQKLYLEMLFEVAKVWNYAGCVTSNEPPDNQELIESVIPSMFPPEKQNLNEEKVVMDIDQANKLVRLLNLTIFSLNQHYKEYLKQHRKIAFDLTVGRQKNEITKGNFFNEIPFRIRRLMIIILIGREAFEAKSATMVDHNIQQKMHTDSIPFVVEIMTEIARELHQPFSPAYLAAKYAGLLTVLKDLSINSEEGSDIATATSHSLGVEKKN